MLWIGPIKRTAGIHGKAAHQAWAASHGMMRAMQAGQAMRPTAQYLLMRQAAYMRPTEGLVEARDSKAAGDTPG